VTLLSPIRLLILAALGYILYRLLFGKGRACTNGSSSQAMHNRQADDVLVEDPVCHLYIPQQGADSLKVLGTTYYFCSPECRQKFQSEKR
jgi:YHS domain-containing protein